MRSNFLSLSNNVPYLMGQKYQVELAAQGGLLEVWVDGARIFQINDAVQAKGGIAFYTWMNTGALCDNVQVNPIE